MKLILRNRSSSFKNVILNCRVFSNIEDYDLSNNKVSESTIKKYVLSMFPYPSGNLHMGHARVYTISDVLARYWRLKGYSVLHPIGWDSFGLPAENAAIERNLDPSIWTVQNANEMREQLKRLNISFDWSNEIFTSSKDYYVWTQWLFLQLYNHNLVYQKESYVNWDPIDKTVLANEQVDSKGIAWRSGACIEKRKLLQWFVKITNYQDRLYNGIDSLDWPKSVKKMQKEWIGKIKGAYFSFDIINLALDSQPNLIQNIECFTEYPACIYGVSFIAVDQNHYLCESNEETALLSYCAIHPFTNHKIPIIVSEEVVKPYGNGSILGIPSLNILHKKIAKSYNLDIINVSIILLQPAYTYIVLHNISQWLIWACFHILDKNNFCFLSSYFFMTTELYSSFICAESQKLLDYCTFRRG